MTGVQISAPMTDPDDLGELTCGSINNLTPCSQEAQVCFTTAWCGSSHPDQTQTRIINRCLLASSLMAASTSNQGAGADVKDCRTAGALHLSLKVFSYRGLLVP
jgi:hypothetical protein